MLEKHFGIIKSPIYSEKATAQSELSKYYFKVSSDANRIQVKNAIESIFKVKVQKVNILKVKGKKRIFKQRKGSTTGYKKAIVTVEKGKVIDFTAGA